jgi:F420H(2)-dependent quinone reductase
MACSGAAVPGYLANGSVEAWQTVARAVDRYFILTAHPETRIEVGTETIDVLAAVATGTERRRLFAKAMDRYSQRVDAAK